MGTWGEGPFDNDDAADWVWELEDADDPAETVLELLDEATEVEYLEAGDASLVVATAAWLTQQLPDVPRYEGGPESAPPQLTPEIAAAAVKALDGVLSPESEWRELWEESGGTEPIEQAEQLRAVLRARLA